MDPTIHSVEEIFAQLTQRDEHILVSMPYRVGLYLSYSDTTGGWEAQEAEWVSLAAILREFSEDFCKTEFSQRVLMDCLKYRADWPAWSQNIGTVPDDVAHINAVLTPMFMPKELNGFKDVMIDVALAVAMAFREHAPAPSEKFSIRDFVSKLSLSRKTDPLSHINISVQERDALRKVCSAMNYEFAG